MLALIDKRREWIYKEPYTHYDRNNGELYIVYDVFFQPDKGRHLLKLYSDLISDSDDKQTMKCFLNYWKCIPLRKTPKNVQHFLDLEWDIIDEQILMPDVSKRIVKQLDIRGLTDETLNTELGKIEKIF